jgi:Tol biopolymer transport system component
MKKKCIVIVLAMMNSLLFAQNNVGVFTNTSDVGHPKNAGATTYDATAQSYNLKGSGYNIWFNKDEFQYAYKKLAGDFILTASFDFIGDAGNAHRKIGWMIRTSTDAEAQHISAVAHGDGLTVLQWRALRGAYMRDPEDEITFPKKKTQVIQLERKGKTIIMRVARFGEALQVVGMHDMNDMPDSVLAGIFICSHDSDAIEQARVWNVRIDQPVAETYNQDKEGYLGSRLEVLNVTDGTRKVIHESTGRFEAPNWMPDGKKLLFNENGNLYTIPIDGGATEQLNTSDAHRNNNDHGISFDGKMLAISSHREGLPGYGSTVYVLPLTGGIPKLVTEQTPSYFHGWSVNGREIYVVAQRNGGNTFNLYKVDVASGKETPLTTNKNGHVDGPEASPDGKYIYYNANPTGTMQIWRMKPDGTGSEQLTFDSYNNWFPHISPDGKWMVFISFPPDIDPDSHPALKRVMLRLMPLTQVGTPKVIAYLYGGQGTLNAPSWSPDSKYIAFVSNSQKF